MKETMRIETRRFVVRSFGHGAAFCLTYKERKREVFLQGDDACLFNDAWCSLSEAKPHWDNDGLLGELWLCYMDAATPCAA